MPSVFLSHSHADKNFARRLGTALRGMGARVWIDEAEIRVGDSLIEKVSDGLVDADYLIVVLSMASSRSEWVRREVNIALNREIGGIGMKVIPCLLEDCKLPPFLMGKKYADFRSPHSFFVAREELRRALGLPETDATWRFLNNHVFYDMEDLNDGYDASAIRYFSVDDFAVALDRFEFFGVEVFGIEPWPDGQFGGVKIHEDYSERADDATWYRTAFREFIDAGVRSHYAGSYRVPEAVLRLFERVE